MEFINFCNMVKSELQSMTGDTITVRLEEITKNNNIIRRAVILNEKELRVAPSIYLEGYYAEYMDGKSIMEICLDILRCHVRHREVMKIDISQYGDYEAMRKYVFIKVINKDMNEKFLKNVPWIEFNDLAVVSYILIEDDNVGRATINITTKNIEMWNISKDELFQQAIENTKENMKVSFSTIKDVLEEIMQEKSEEFQLTEDAGIYVLTNDSKLNGAMYIYLDEVLENVCNEIEDDFYILPSSIHELLIIPKANGMNVDELKDMVINVNNTAVEPGEVLSDSVYEYVKSEGLIWHK